MNCSQLPGTSEIAVSSLWRAKLFHHHCNLVVSRTFSNLNRLQHVFGNRYARQIWQRNFPPGFDGAAVNQIKSSGLKYLFNVYSIRFHSILSKRCQYRSQTFSLTFDAHLNFKNCRPQESTSLCWDQRIDEQIWRTLDLCASCCVSCLAKAPMTLAFLNCVWQMIITWHWTWSSPDELPTSEPAQVILFRN